MLSSECPCRQVPSLREAIDLLRERAPVALNAAGRPEIAPVAWKRIASHGRELMRRPLPRFTAAAAACLAIVATWLSIPGQQSTAQAFQMFADAPVDAKSTHFSWR